MIAPEADGFLVAEKQYNTITELVSSDVVPGQAKRLNGSALVKAFTSYSDNGHVVTTVAIEDAANYMLLTCDLKKLPFAVGDSVNLVIPAANYTVEKIEKPTTDKFVSEFTPANILAVSSTSTVINSNNKVECAEIYTKLSERDWLTKQNRLVATELGKFVQKEAWTAKGFCGMVFTDGAKSDTLAVALEYYVAAGSPDSAVVRGFVGADLTIDVAAKSYSVITPRSAEDFMSPLQEFDNIRAMVNAGKAASSAILYKVNSPMTITGVSTIQGEMGMNINVIFVTDSTASLELQNIMENREDFTYTTGNTFKGLSGVYVQGFAKPDYADYARANSMTFSSIDGVEAVTPAVEVNPVTVTLIQLLESDKYASSLVRLENLTYKKVVFEDDFGPLSVNGTITKYFLCQGADSIEVGGKFTINNKVNSIVGNWYLDSFAAKLYPRTQEDIESEVVAVDNVYADEKLYVQNGNIVAEGATIYLFDITGRLVAQGVNSVNIANLPQSIFVATTVYENGKMFSTKVARR